MKENGNKPKSASKLQQRQQCTSTAEQLRSAWCVCVCVICSVLGWTACYLGWTAELNIQPAARLAEDSPSVCSCTTSTGLCVSAGVSVSVRTVSRLQTCRVRVFATFVSQPFFSKIRSSSKMKAVLLNSDWGEVSQASIFSKSDK